MSRLSRYKQDRLADRAAPVLAPLDCHHVLIVIDLRPLGGGVGVGGPGDRDRHLAGAIVAHSKADPSRRQGGGDPFQNSGAVGAGHIKDPIDAHLGGVDVAFSEYLAVDPLALGA